MSQSFEPAPRVLEASFSAAARNPDELPAATQVEIAFAGRSNVGKSSLLNSLMHRRHLARTSSTPGCTRQLNFFALRLEGDAGCCLVDLPGYGYAERGKRERLLWAELVEQYLLERVTLRAVAVLVDARRGLEADDRNLLELLRGASSPQRAAPEVLVVATKLDKIPRPRRTAELARLAQSHPRVFGFSTELRETTERVWSALYSLAGLGLDRQ